MQYTREVPLTLSEEDFKAAIEHVRDHLASVADTDDDPDTHASDVVVTTDMRHGYLVITGTLDARPSAPYLAPDYDPYDGVEPTLAAQGYDDEVIR